MTQTVTTLANGDKQIVITGTETWVIPLDWNDKANKFEAYGAGGNGATGTASIAGGGGGGGSYQSVSNLPLYLYSITPNPIDGQKVAILNTVNTASSSFYTLFTVYQDDGATPPAAVYVDGVTANAGSSSSNGSITGGLGGNAPVATITIFSVPGAGGGNYTTVQFRGGNGGNGRASTTAAAGGGGGAAGPNGVGGAGGANTTTLGTTGRGGGGGNGGGAGSGTAATAGTAGTGAGAGGAGGAASTSGSAGGVGTYAATPYIFSGGGGGGAGDGTTTTSGGAGGLYGAGGGGGASSTISTGGLGSIGVLVITYTPTTPSKFFMMF